MNTKQAHKFSMLRTARLALYMITALYGSGVVAMVLFNTLGQ